MTSSTDMEAKRFIESQRAFLQALIELTEPVDTLLKQDQIGWADWPEYLVTLTRQDLLQILARFLRGELDAQQLQDWAEALEARGTVQREPGYEGLINDVLFTLANEPSWGNNPTPESVTSLITNIQAGTY